MLGFIVGSLENRRFRENVMIGGLTLLGLGVLARQNAARTGARLIAWINQEPSSARPGTGLRRALGPWLSSERGAGGVAYALAICSKNPYTPDLA
jgi:hypothetical protein